MKKLISIILAAAVVLMSAAAVFAEDTAYTLTVNGTEIDLSDLPRARYESDGHIMIPLRKTAEALGYRVEWDAETGNITVDDDYIQGALLHSGTAKMCIRDRRRLCYTDSTRHAVCRRRSKCRM